MSNENMILSPKEITDFTINIGKAKANFSPWRTRLLSIMAGVFISIGAMASTKVAVVLDGMQISSILSSFVFTIGIVGVVISGGELFTGNILLTLAALDKKITIKQTLTNWLRVYIWNFIGAILFALIVFSTFYNDKNLLSSFHFILASKLSIGFLKSFFLGVLCNILVCFSVWISFSSKDGISKMLLSMFPIFIFVLLKYEHIVANMFYYSVGIFSGLDINPITLILKYLLPVTLGNIVGGVLFSAAYYYAFKKF